MVRIAIFVLKKICELYLDMNLALYLIRLLYVAPVFQCESMSVSATCLYFRLTMSVNYYTSVGY